METVLIAVGAIVPMLVFLVVVHELGHFATARAMGVKVLEFGIGFPPRALVLYTGRTRVLLDPSTSFSGVASSLELSRGQLVRVSSSEDMHGNLVARHVEVVPSRSLLKRNSDQPQEQPDSIEQSLESQDLLRHEGKIRDMDGGSFILADLLYSLNWAPLGGFVRLAGENNPNVPRSLAGKGAGTRIIVLAAGSLMNAILPLLIFTILFMVPQGIVVGQVQVTEVSQGSPAEAAGLVPGDVVLSANGEKIEAVPDLARLVNLNGGSAMEWLVLRNGVQERAVLEPEFGVPEGRWLVGINIVEQEGRVVVVQVAPGSPASAAGIREGDSVVAAGERSISAIGQLTGAIALNQGSEMEWVLEQSGQQRTVRITPAFEQPETQQWLTGATTRLVNAREETRSEPLWSAVPASFVSTWELLVLVKQALTGAISSGNAPQVAGPVGIAKVAGEFTREGGFTGWLVITILLSVNLAIINILPIPMLDGGRLVFVVLEWLRRGRRVPPEKEGLVHLIGFVVLIAGILLITANDIRQLLPG